LRFYRLISDLPIYEYEYDEENSVSGERGAVQVKNLKNKIAYLFSSPAGSKIEENDFKRARMD